MIAITPAHSPSPARLSTASHGVALRGTASPVPPDARIDHGDSTQ